MNKYEFTEQHVVGFHGAQGCGKDTLAAAIEFQVSRTRVLALARTLKTAASTLFGRLGHLALRGTQAQKDAIVDQYGMSAREILQKMGDFVATIDPHALSVALEQELRLIRKYTGNTLLVPDFRRLSEFEFEYGCPKIVIGLTRNMHKVPTHHTDTLMFNKCTHVIHNADMTKEETLADAIAFLLRRGAIREL